MEAGNPEGVVGDRGESVLMMQGASCVSKDSHNFVLKTRHVISVYWQLFHFSFFLGIKHLSGLYHFHCGNEKKYGLSSDIKISIFMKYVFLISSSSFNTIHIYRTNHL